MSVNILKNNTFNKVFYLKTVPNILISIFTHGKVDTYRSALYVKICIIHTHQNIKKIETIMYLLYINRVGVCGSRGLKISY